MASGSNGGGHFPRRLPDNCIENILAELDDSEIEDFDKNDDDVEDGHARKRPTFNLFADIDMIDDTDDDPLKVIQSYNQHMGGVDLADRMLAVCPSRARTCKWTITCMLHFFDVGLSNAWLQYRNVQREKNVPRKDIPQFRTFKLEAGQRMINNTEESEQSSEDENEYDDEENLDGRKNSLPTPERRKKGAGHLPDVTTGLQKRCRFPKCNKKTSVRCIKCRIYLCLMGDRNCYLKFHKQ